MVVLLKTTEKKKERFNPIQDGPFLSCSRMGEDKKPPSPYFSKICYTYPAMMKRGTVVPKEETKAI